VHADATQACGWLEFDGRFAAKTVSVAPHKFGGPRGIGGLLVRRGMPLAAVTPGSQESGLRGGTEAVVLAEGFATAVELVAADRGREAARIALLRDAFERRVVASARRAGIAAEVIPAGGAPRAPHISTIAFPGLDRQAVVMAADLAGIACSTGTACASGSAEPSPAIVAMGFSRAIVAAAVRFSFGRTTHDHDADAAFDVIGRMLSAMAAAPRRTSGA
jgi:cysteine desulfurase